MSFSERRGMSSLNYIEVTINVKRELQFKRQGFEIITLHEFNYLQT